MDNFPKGSVHGFSQNYKICLFHLFRLNTPKNVFGNVLDRKLAFLHHKNMDKENSRKIGNFPKGFVHSFFGQNHEISLFLLFS